jgi:single-stranded-DNA-specific exonuclease
LLEALDCCSRFFEKHGGHAQAVGCTLKQEFADKKGIRQLSEALQAYADSVLSAEDLVPSLTIDAVLDVEDVNPGLCKDLERLGPFGIGNPVPSFTTEQVPISRGPWILKEQHLKLELEGNGRPLDVIWWRNKEAARGLEPGTPIDLVYSVSCDTYRGQEKILLTVKDMRSQSPNRSP